MHGRKFDNVSWWGINSKSVPYGSVSWGSNMSFFLVIKNTLILYTKERKKYINKINMGIPVKISCNDDISIWCKFNVVVVARRWHNKQEDNIDNILKLIMIACILPKFMMLHRALKVTWLDSTFIDIFRH